MKLLEILGPDPDDKAKKAEGDAGQKQDRQHRDGVRDTQIDEEEGRHEDDEPDREGFRGGGQHVTGGDLEKRGGCGEVLVDRPDEFREVDPEGGVRDRLGEDGQHDQARDEERAVAHALDLVDPAADGRPENHEVEGRGEDRRDHRLQERPEGARHLEPVDRADRLDIHDGSPFPSARRPTKISSSEDSRVDTSRSFSPAPCRSFRSRVIPVRSP